MKKLWLLLPVIFLLYYPITSFSETIFLNDGSSITGTILTVQEKYYVVEIEYGVLSIPKSDIDRIEIDSSDSYEVQEDYSAPYSYQDEEDFGYDDYYDEYYEPDETEYYEPDDYYTDDYEYESNDLVLSFGYSADLLMKSGQKVFDQDNFIFHGLNFRMFREQSWWMITMSIRMLGMQNVDGYITDYWEINYDRSYINDYYSSYRENLFWMYYDFGFHIRYAFSIFVLHLGSDIGVHDLSVSSSSYDYYSYYDTSNEDPMISIDAIGGIEVNIFSWFSIDLSLRYIAMQDYDNSDSEIEPFIEEAMNQPFISIMGNINF